MGWLLMHITTTGHIVVDFELGKFCISLYIVAAESNLNCTLALAALGRFFMEWVHKRARLEHVPDLTAVSCARLALLL